MDAFAGRLLTEVTAADIAGLVSRQVPESVNLDYKRELSLASDRDKRDFLADITAFANGLGGVLIYGVDETREEGRPTSLPGAVDGFPLENPDELVKTMDALARDGVDERLPALGIHLIALTSGKYVVLVRVPASLRAPHMVTLGKERRFYRRVNGGNEPMSTAQVRDAVLRTDTVAEQITTFVQRRLDVLQCDAKEQPFWAIHIVPLYRNPSLIDVTSSTVVSRLRQLPLPSLSASGEQTHCLEGYKRFWAAPTHNCHTLVFRDGAVECAERGRFVNRYAESKEPVLNPWLYHRCIVDVFDGIRSVLLQDMIPVPVALFLSLGNLPQTRMLLGEFTSDFEPHYIPSGSLRAGSYLYTDPSVDGHAAFRPAFNLIWNAAGFRACPAYADDGTYIDYKNMGERLYRG